MNRNQFLIAAFSIAGVVAFALLVRNTPEVTSNPIDAVIVEVEDNVELPPALDTSVEFVDVELDKAKQKAVWDAEHVTFEIEKRFGTVFREALVQRDAEQLQARFLADCRGVIPAEDDLTSVRHGSMSRMTGTADATKPASAEQLVDWLLSSVQPLGNISGSKLRVLSIVRDAELQDVWHTKTLLSVTGTDADNVQQQLTTHQDVTFLIPDESTLGVDPAIQEWQHQSSTSF